MIGKGTDPDGSITTYKWTKISGAVSGLISNTNTAATLVSGLTKGVYRFQLKVTDNKAATAIDTIRRLRHLMRLMFTQKVKPKQGNDRAMLHYQQSTVNLSGSGTRHADEGAYQQANGQGTQVHCTQAQ